MLVGLTLRFPTKIKKKKTFLKIEKITLHPITSKRIDGIEEKNN
jgi:hypothetical protein